MSRSNPVRSWRSPPSREPEKRDRPLALAATHTRPSGFSSRVASLFLASLSSAWAGVYGARRPSTLRHGPKQRLCLSLVLLLATALPVACTADRVSVSDADGVIDSLTGDTPSDFSADGCTPECAGLECGDDGCGGSCGDCPSAAPVCLPDQTCGVNCDLAVQCAGKVCGPSGCAAPNDSCGSCAVDEVCDTGQCVLTCVPDCTGLECGDDGCGGSCGDCPSSDPTCTAEGLCTSAPPMNLWDEGIWDSNLWGP